MTLTTIKDALKDLVQALQISTIFPSAMLVLSNFYLVLPSFYPDVDPASPVAVTIVISLTLILSYTFHAFNFTLARFFEGYLFKEHEWAAGLLQKQKNAYQNCLKEIDLIWRELDQFKLVGKSPSGRTYQELRIRLAKLESQRETKFPLNQEMILPTRVGNAIAAFEAYPGIRYGMDSIALWPRLVPLLKEKGYLEFVVQEKSVFDFLMNLLVVVPLVGIELTCLTAFKGMWISVILFAATLFSIWGLYNGLIVAAIQWGITFKVAFDLFRHDLYQRLGLISVYSFEDEYGLWERLSKFLLHRSVDHRQFRDFLTHQRVREKQTKAGK